MMSNSLYQASKILIIIEGGAERCTIKHEYDDDESTS